MQLRSGIFIRSGQKSSQRSGSNPSTGASTTRTLNTGPSLAQQKEQNSETSSKLDESMETGQSEGLHDNSGLDYNSRLDYQGLNRYGAKIYKDMLGRYLVKIEDHPSPDEPQVMANYQEDRYMGPHGVMYLVVEDPDHVGPLGEMEPDIETSERENDEKPPPMDPREYKLFNSARVKRVPIDDPTKGLYTQLHEGERNFYEGDNSLTHPLTPEKTLYSFCPKSSKAVAFVLFLDKYGKEWNLLDDKGLEAHQHLGRPVSQYFKEDKDSVGGNASSDTHKDQVKTPPQSRPKDHRKEGDKSTHTHGDSGHSGHRGPNGPKGSFGSRHVNFMGGPPTRGAPMEHPRRTRPSNFQKWVKKYNGSGDPYDHLASFKQVVRAEQIIDHHTQVEGFGLTLESKALSWF